MTIVIFFPRAGEEGKWKNIANCSYSCYNYRMNVTQTVDIPANRRITIDVPLEVPTGPVILTFTPALPIKRKMTETEEIEYINSNAENLNKEAMDVLLYQVDIF